MESAIQTSRNRMASTKGAFTGADTDKGGYFDAAKGGKLLYEWRE